MVGVANAAISAGALEGLLHLVTTAEGAIRNSTPAAQALAADGSSPRAAAPTTLPTATTTTASHTNPAITTAAASAAREALSAATQLTFSNKPAAAALVAGDHIARLSRLLTLGSDIPVLPPDVQVAVLGVSVEAAGLLGKIVSNNETCHGPAADGGMLDRTADLLEKLERQPASMSELSDSLESHFVRMLFSMAFHAGRPAVAAVLERPVVQQRMQRLLAECAANRRGQASALAIRGSLLVALMYGREESSRRLGGEAAAGRLAEVLVEATRATLARCEYPPGSNNFFGAWKLVHGMRELASADSHKHALLQAGAIPLLIDCLFVTKKENSKAERVLLHGLHTLYHLSFVDKGKEEMLRSTKLLARLEAIAQSDASGGADDDASGGAEGGRGSRETAELARGILFELGLVQPAAAGGPGSADEASSAPAPNHVMISYCWAGKGKESAAWLASKLKSAGVPVWIDVEAMQGHASILEAMASAVEGACAVVILVSPEYKQSQACRTEAEFAYRIRKPLVPLMLADYTPDGWLGALVGLRFYFTFSSAEHRQRQLPNVLREVQKLRQASGADASSQHVTAATRDGQPAAGSEGGGRGGAGGEAGADARRTLPPLAAWPRRKAQAVLARSSFGRDFPAGLQNAHVAALNGAALAELVRLRNGMPAAEFVAWLQRSLRVYPLPAALALSTVIGNLD